MSGKLGRPLAATLVVIGGSLCVAPIVGADQPSWNGWYQLTFHTDQKSGTSMAATQRETPYTAAYLFSTNCSSGQCIASVVDGPTPKDNVTSTVKFDWTGSQWSRTNDWRWDCQLGDGTITFDPANSVTSYVPQPDGSLAGTFQTTISDGACKGTVAIPVTAVPS